MAGLASAVLLARAGTDVCVLERRADPSQKVCAGGLSGRSLHLLSTLAMPFVHGRPVHTIEFNAVPWHYNRFSTARPMAVVSDRSAINASMMGHARDSGVTVLHREVRRVEHDGRGFTVHTDRETFSAPYLIGADGATSRVRRSLGGTAPRMARAVMVERLARKRPLDFSAFDYGVLPQGYGWVFPTGERTVNAGLFTIGDEKGADLRRVLASYVDDRLGRAEWEAPVRGGLLPWGGCRLDERVPVLLTGDAGGHTDPFTGEGIFQALYTARAAARAVLSHKPGEVRRAYERRLRKLGANAWLMNRLGPRAYSRIRTVGRLGEGFLFSRVFFPGLARGKNWIEMLAAAPWLMACSSLFPEVLRREHDRNLSLAQRAGLRGDREEGRPRSRDFPGGDGTVVHPDYWEEKGPHVSG